MNMGHGHVTPNPDGSRARCGGPPICPVCALEAAQLKQGKMQGKEVGFLDLIEMIRALESRIFQLELQLRQLDADTQEARSQTARIGSAD